MNYHAPAISPTGPAGPPNGHATPPDQALPVIVVRFPATYAWLAIAFGALFLLLGLFFALLNPDRNLGFGLFLSVVSLAAAIGANYWRLHLHVVAQLTPHQLILRRDGAINWSDIAAIESTEIRSSYRGVGNRSHFACIRLKRRRPPKGRLHGFLHKVKQAVTGYDIIVPGSELSCSADWFVAECQKRIAAASTAD